MSSQGLNDSVSEVGKGRFRPTADIGNQRRPIPRQVFSFARSNLRLLAQNQGFQRLLLCKEMLRYRLERRN